MRKPTALHSASGIVIFYPGGLLTSQIQDWARRYGGCRATVSFERTLPGVRRWLRRSAFTIIDATVEPEQASDVFLQAVGVQKADSVAVYTEKSHETLEMLVRTLGAPLLLGPMNSVEWDEFLDHKFPTLIPLGASDSGILRAKHGTLRATGDSVEDNVIHYRPIAG
jgi:hypothetical protein